MIVAIQDANILIDLCKTGLLEPYAQLGLKRTPRISFIGKYGGGTI